MRIRIGIAALSFAINLPAYGLGFGELTVASGLGQPLRAHVPLLGEETGLDQDCFRVQAAGGNLPSPPDMHLSMETPAGKRPALRISTRSPVNDPAMGFVLVAQCEGQLQKEYVLLLDPVDPPHRIGLPVAETQAATEDGQRPPAVFPAIAEAPQAPASQAATRTPASRPVRGKPANRPKPQPRLVLSGTRNFEGGDAGALSLRLDLSLPDPSRVRPAPLSETELSDESAALNRKLDHLERQLAALQERNTELLRQAQAAEIAPTRPIRRSGTPQWPYLLLGLLLSSAAIALVLYRHSGRRGGPPGEAPRIRTARAPVLSRRTVRARPGRLETRAAPASAPSSQDDDLLFEPARGTEIRDSMKDEVEVFIAHGNTTLAIELLESHVRESPEGSPVPWLLLLDLLQRENLSSKYEAASRQCKQHFNVEIPSPDRLAAASGKPGLEAYPHILAGLTRVWTSDKAIPYLDDLLRDSRNGSRTGLSLAAFNEILLLRSIRAREAAGSW